MMFGTTLGKSKVNNEMLTELICYNQDTDLQTIFESIFVSSEKSMDSVGLLSGFMPKVEEFLHNQTFAAAVDFPYGLSTTQVRLHEAILAIRSGAKIIDIVLNSFDIKNENWRGIREDLKACKTLCDQNDVKLRPILEYRLFEIDKIIHLCETLERLRLFEIVNSTGTILDDISENAAMSYVIQRQTSLSVVSCSPILNSEQYNMFKEMGIYGVRFKSPAIADNILSDGV